MTQAVLVYVTFASGVLLICWFGTQLTQYVRKNGVFFSCYACANISHISCDHIFNKQKSVPETKCVPLLFYQFLYYITDALQCLQQQRWQMKKLGKMPHICGRGKKQDVN